MPLIGPPLRARVDIPNLLRGGLGRAPDDPAVVSDGLRYSWRDMERATDALARNFLGLGLAPGERVASLMPNRAVLLVHYLASMKAGLVSVPLNYRYTVPEIDHALAVSGASVLLADRERLDELAKSSRIRDLRSGLILHEAEPGRGPNLLDLIASTPANTELPIPKSADPAFIFFTSGSTRPAKGVTHTYETLGWMFAAYAASLEIAPGDVVLPGGSLSHLASFGHCFGALAAGARVVVAESIEGPRLLRLLREQRPTVFWTQPVTLFRLVRDPTAQRADFSSLRVCRTGGDKTPAELAREFTALTGMMINEGYGMTEVGLVAVNPISGVVKPGSIGKAAPGLRLSIRDDGDEETPAGAQGSLWINGPSVMTGYWDDPASTAAVMRDGWLDSGDVMRADEEGYLSFCGRKKQLIVHDGSNISPQEVEDALLQHAAVAIAAVVGVYDLVHGENVRAYIVLKPGLPAPTAQELIEFARVRVGYKAPADIEFLAEMPLTTAGKVDRTALKRLAATQEAAQAPGSDGLEPA